MDRGQSGNIFPSQEDHSTGSQGHYPHHVAPETQNVPESQVSHFKSGLNLASLTGRRSNAVYNPSAFPFPDDTHQAASESVFSTGSVQAPPRRYHPRTKLTGGFSPVQVDKPTVGSSQTNRQALIDAQSSTASQHIQDITSESRETSMNPSIPKVHPPNSQKSGPEASGYHPAYGFPNSFSHDGAHWLQKGLNPTEKKTDAIRKGHSPGRKSAGKVAPHMSYPPWSPRGYSGDVMSEARGYAHVRHLKPGFDKTWHQAGFVVPASSERQLDPHGRGKQPGIWHPPQPDGAQTPVQGKFKPFQRVSTDELPAHNHSDSKTAPTPTSNQTTLPPSLNSTGIASSVVPSAAGELSTESASPMTADGQDEVLEPQASTPEGQSERSGEVGPFSEQNKPFKVSPPELQPAEKER